MVEPSVTQLRVERDLYRRLLEMGSHDSPDVLLDEALDLVLESTGARRAFLALFARDVELPRWWRARGFADAELSAIQRSISSGVISDALTSGEPVRSDSASLDPRYRDNTSINLNGIQAVLCIPIGRALGVLYLQDRAGGGRFDDGELDRAVLFAKHFAPLADRMRMREREAPDPTAPYRARLKLDRLVGASRALADVFAQLEGAARFAVPVLITGASGTGKTALARAIHDNGPRATGPFLELNCAAIPENLFESELFGANAGAHSTATKKLAGKIAAAQGGTLFLDEIGELPVAVQSKLLQFLHSREYFPLGATQPEKANVRIVAATNADLRAAVDAKTFREDLFYRLNVLAIALPTLAERTEDIEPLARALARSACATNELPELALSASALEAAKQAVWPGNVRQLAHAIEAAAIRAALDGSAAIELRHLFPDDKPRAQAKPPTFQDATRAFQAQLVRETLNAAEWNISETARRLDLTRTHVRHLIRAFGLRTDE